MSNEEYEKARIANGLRIIDYIKNHATDEELIVIGLDLHKYHDEYWISVIHEGKVLGWDSEV